MPGQDIFSTKQSFARKIRGYKRGFGYTEFHSKNDEKAYRMDLEVRVEQFSNDEPAAFLIDCSITGIFELEKETSIYTSKEEIKYTAKAVEILYNLLGGYISGITGAFPSGKYIFDEVAPEHIVEQHEAIKNPSEASKKERIRKLLQAAPA
jgi:preprotein translocase subunit SecB